MKVKMYTLSEMYSELTDSEKDKMYEDLAKNMKKYFTNRFRTFNVTSQVFDYENNSSLLIVNNDLGYSIQFTIGSLESYMIEAYMKTNRFRSVSKFKENFYKRIKTRTFCNNAVELDGFAINYKYNHRRVKSLFKAIDLASDYVIDGQDDRIRLETGPKEQDKVIYGFENVGKYLLKGDYYD